MSDIEATCRLGGDLPVQRLGFGAMRICGPGIWGHPGALDPLRGLRRALRSCIVRGTFPFEPPETGV